MGEREKIRSAIVEAAENNLENLIALPGGGMYAPGGVNGPYFDLETPIRNSAHWIITYSVLSREFPEKGFLGAANSLVDFLLDPSFFEKAGVYIHRQKHGKDWSNGVIGQAWVIEALAIAGRILERDDAFRRAETISQCFPFDSSVAAWMRVDPRNGNRAIDYTLNHQLWYAAALSELVDSVHNERIVAFLDMLNDGGVRVGKDGRILHLLHSRSLKGGLLRLRYSLGRMRGGEKLKRKEVGYHLYNLHPLARLKRRFQDHALFSSQVVMEALRCATDSSFISELERNGYAYPYNAPGFELPLVLEEFDLEMVHAPVIKRQRDSTFRRVGYVCGFVGNTPDFLTLNARAYEYLV